MGKAESRMLGWTTGHMSLAGESQQVDKSSGMFCSVQQCGNQIRPMYCTTGTVSEVIRHVMFTYVIEPSLSR